MTGKGGGVEAIVQGKIDASVTYASRGDMVIQTAAKILHHEPFLRDTILPTMLVDASVAETMLLMSHEIERICDTECRGYCSLVRSVRAC